MIDLDLIVSLAIGQLLTAFYTGGLVWQLLRGQRPGARDWFAAVLGPCFTAAALVFSKEPIPLPTLTPQHITCLALVFIATGFVISTRWLKGKEGHYLPPSRPKESQAQIPPDAMTKMLLHAKRTAEVALSTSKEKP